MVIRPECNVYGVFAAKLRYQHHVPSGVFNLGKQNPDEALRISCTFSNRFVGSAYFLDF